MPCAEPSSFLANMYLQCAYFEYEHFYIQNVEQSDL